MLIDETIAKEQPAPIDSSNMKDLWDSCDKSRKRQFEIINNFFRAFHTPITIIDRDIKLIHKGKSSPDFYKDVQIIFEALKIGLVAHTNIFGTAKNQKIKIGFPFLFHFTKLQFFVKAFFTDRIFRNGILHALLG
ncbi:hypothetical protein ROZALSC1DRAFT_21715 [Rozella allomycis CSF55]|uniref:Uncharacterized protein n=1 Tax=Rozella allomycis (strain CSF55) TaxID=988480 RepID=A0A4P9YKF2_ROZAC|nr:hypothetical protein ROZALSC1DRAFT_21715 [Rozella allomycis CSF55]